jgi:hypothetical protein
MREGAFEQLFISKRVPQRLFENLHTHPSYVSFGVRIVS